MAISGKKHVLIVEDAPDLQALLARLLEDEGYSLTRAFNGRQALDLLRSMDELPSFILLDIMMPVMDGLEFRQEQRNDKRLAHIPVVVMTADPALQIKASRLEVSEVMRKPIAIDRLLEIAARLSA